MAKAKTPAAKKPKADKALVVTPNPPGAPCLLTPELQATIVKYIQAGTYIETAAIAAGVTKKTFYNWLKQANEDLAAKPDEETKFTSFLHAVEKALAEAELADINRIGVCAVGRAAEYDQDGNCTRAEVVPQWQASAWRLERKFPKKYGRLDRIAGADGGPIAVRSASHEEIAAVIKKELEDAAQATPSEGFG